MGRKSKERKAMAAGRQLRRVCDVSVAENSGAVARSAAESGGGNALSVFYRQKERRPKPPSFLVVNNH